MKSRQRIPSNLLFVGQPGDIGQLLIGMQTPMAEWTIFEQVRTSSLTWWRQQSFELLSSPVDDTSGWQKGIHQKKRESGMMGEETKAKFIRQKDKQTGLDSFDSIE
eukprot:scaffold147_cov113-Cylindrotheca_fusiformis.AAC.6